MVLNKIRSLPIGYSEVVFKNKKYGVTRTDYNDGKSMKVYAKELGGSDFVSLNFYITSLDEKLKPCEMPEEKVIQFLNEMRQL